MTYEELCASLRAYLNIHPDDKSTLRELAVMAVKEARRHGGGGILDLVFIQLAEHVEEQKDLTK